MKRITFILTATLLCVKLFAQTDTTKVPSTGDTIRIGGMVIIKRSDGNDGRNHTTITLGNRKKKKHSNISTAHWIVDLGFAILEQHHRCILLTNQARLTWGKMILN